MGEAGPQTEPTALGGDVRPQTLLETWSHKGGEENARMCLERGQWW